MENVEGSPPKKRKPGFQPGNSYNKSPEGNQYATKHGLNTVRNAIKILGERVLNRRTAAGRALIEWRKDLIRDLGGDVSTQQAAIVSLAIKTKLLLDSIDVWLLQQPTLINKRKKAIIPAVAQRHALADALARYMSMLGLHRRTKLTSLSEMLAEDDKPQCTQSTDGNGES